MNTAPLAGPASAESGASPFHAGELMAQQRAGMRDKMQKIGSVALRAYMPQQHRDFFALLPTLFVGGSDAAGRVWASMFWNRPGFMRAPDPVTLRIDARPLHDDPLREALQPGAQLGFLGLQFETRRRNRANGVLAALDAHGFTVDVQQSFGNCAKYIQTRELIAGPVQGETGAPIRGEKELPAAAVDLIARSDTFFIASMSGATANAAGADVSHRGGKPGFVRVEADGVLAWPDFQGNYFFNTIGNLMLDARAGLLFVDFERGDLLHLSGRADVAWAEAQDGQSQRAQRLLRFTTERYVYRPHVLPWRWKLREYSPHLDDAGSGA